jgi:RNA polymerase sigma-54 factor
MNAIISYQREYFVDGDEIRLKPMILKDIADKTGLDVSTISRVSNSKYIQTHFGTFQVKYFFSEGMQKDDGEEVSTREIKKILKDCIENEDKRKPLTDQKLSDILKEKSYNIARRTVAKYREQMGYPVARLRKEI